MTSKELLDDMNNYYGTDHYYKTMFPKVYYTDGVKNFCEKANAYWFLTDVIAYMPEYITKDDFFSVKLIVDKNKKYTINISDGNENTYKELKGETDCPEGDWKFFIEQGDMGWIILYYLEH